MYRTKSDVDKYVERILEELSTKEIKSRGLSIGRLYFEVEDYGNCEKYVEKYLSQESRDAAGYKLLGQALQKLGQMDLALEHYKTSLDLDPTDKSIILNICELLSDDRVDLLEPERAQYWCNKADDAFPKHPITFRLRKRLITSCNLDSVNLVQLLKAQVEAKPEDPSIHIRLLEHYISTNEIKQAIEYAYSVEFNTKEVFPFENSSPMDWYELLNKILELYSGTANVNKTWRYQLLLLTVKERLCFLTEVDKNFRDKIYAYDKALEIVAKAGNSFGFLELHTNLLKHHRGQFAFHAAICLLLFVRAKPLERNRNEPAVLMSMAFQSVPFNIHDTRDEIRSAGNRWYLEATYRCSQAGHYLIQEYKQRRCDIQDTLKDENWKERIYDSMYNNTVCSKYGDKNAKLMSHWLSSDAYKFPLNKKPHETEVKAYDGDAQKFFEKQGNSLHYYVRTLRHYENFAHFKCIAPIISNSGPDTLDMLDLDAFLYCTALRSKMHQREEGHYPVHPYKIQSFSNLHRDWWKWAQTDYASLSDDNKVLLKRGIEAVRCTDIHEMDAELLCKLGYIFSERANITTSAEEKRSLQQRASLYYQSAIPLLEEIRLIPIRMFTRKENMPLSSEKSDKLIEESRLWLGINYRNISECDKSIEVLSHLKSGEGYFQIAQTYKKSALGINSNTEVSKFEKMSLLAKARKYAFKAMEHLKKNQHLYIDSKEVLEDIELQINNLDPDLTVLFGDVEKHHSNRIVSTLNAPSHPNENRQIATGSQINTKEQVKESQLSVNEIKDPNKNLDECKRLGEMIKKIAKLTNEVNELKYISFKIKDMGKPVVEGLFCGTPPHNYQIAIRPAVPVAPIFPVSSTMSGATLPTSSTTGKTTTLTACDKISRSLPVNVMITSSDTSPTCTLAPVSNVTIPPKHTEGTPHNNQPTLPTSTDAKVAKQSVFSFSIPDTNYLPTLLSSASNWKAFQNEQSKSVTTCSKPTTTTSTFSWGDKIKPKPANACNLKDSVAVKSNANVEKENTNIDTATQLNVGLKKTEELTTVPVVKPPLLPKPIIAANTSANKESGECNFLFKPAISDKSPAKSPNKSQDDESDIK